MTQRHLLFCAISAVTFPVMAADASTQLPDAPGRATVIKICNACHGAEIVLGRPHTEDGWNQIVIDMVQRGAEGTDDELDEVVRYLTKNIKAGQAQAKVNLNKASAKSIEVSLGLSSKEAEAIVEARGKAAFKSIDDVKKVPGVDPAKIEAKKDRLTFE